MNPVISYHYHCYVYSVINTCCYLLFVKRSKTCDTFVFWVACGYIYRRWRKTDVKKQVGSPEHKKNARTVQTAHKITSFARNQQIQEFDKFLLHHTISLTKSPLHPYLQQRKLASSP